MTHADMVGKATLVRLLLALAIALATLAGLAPDRLAAQAGECREREPNASFGQANDLICFNMQFDPNINDQNNTNISTAFPHATVNGRGVSGNFDTDFFEFTVTDPFTTAYFDIDGTTSGDLTLQVFDGNQSTIGQNQDGGFVDAGSSTTTDPFLVMTLASPGTYYVMVDLIPPMAQYTLHVTLATGVFAPTIDLDANPWSLDFNPDVNDQNNVNTSTTIPHTSVEAVGSDAVDWYELTVEGPSRPRAGTSQDHTAIFDIDYGRQPSDGLGPDDFDSFLKLFDADGNLVGFDDDALVDTGSEHGFDSLLQIELGPGTYYLAVGRFPNAMPIPAGGTYILQVSLEGHSVP